MDEPTWPLGRMLGMSLVAMSWSMLTSTKAPAAISPVGKKALVIFNQHTANLVW